MEKLSVSMKKIYYIYLKKNFIRICIIKYHINNKIKDLYSSYGTVH